MSVLFEDYRRDYIKITTPSGPALKSPGRCRISGAVDERAWEIARGFGLSGAAVRGGGKKLKKFSVTIDLWDRPVDSQGNPGPQWIDANVFFRVLQRSVFAANAAGLPFPSIGVDHPILSAQGISTAVVESIGPWTQDETGLWSRVTAFIEYAAPQPAYAKAGPGIPAIGPSLPTADSAHAAALAAAQRQMELAAGK